MKELIDVAGFKKNTLLNYKLQPALSFVFRLEWIIHLYLKFFL